MSVEWLASVSMWETFFLRNFLCVFMGMFMNELTLFDKTMGRQYFTLSLQHYTTYSLHLFWYLPTEGRFHIFMYRFWFEKIDFPYN